MSEDPRLPRKAELASDVEPDDRQLAVDSVDVALKLFYSDEPSAGPSPECLTDNAMSDFLRDGTARDGVMKHLADCDACARRLVDLRRTRIADPSAPRRSLITLLLNPRTAWVVGSLACVVLIAAFWPRVRNDQKIADRSDLSASIVMRPSPALGRVPRAAGAPEDGGGPRWAVVSPNRTSIATLQPTLHWSPPTGKVFVRYEVSISAYEASGSPQPIATSATSLLLPPGLLSPAGVYVWWVTGVTRDGDETTSESARFAVLDGKSMRAAQAIFADPFRTSIDRLRFAGKNGLLDDAEQQMKAAHIQDPALRDRIEAKIQAARDKN